MILNKKEIIDFIKDKWETELFEVKQIKETRSSKQNALYFKYLTDLVWEFDKKWIFITVDDLHEGLREKLIKWKYHKNLFTWKRKLHRKSTTELNKSDFSNYIKDVEKYLWQNFEISHMLPTDFWYNTAP